MRVKSSLVLCLTLVLSACGGSTKPAEEPESSADSDSKDDASSQDADKSDDASKPEKEENAADKPASADSASSESTSGPSIKRTAKDILTAPDVIFMFSFNASDMKDAAEKQCDQQSSDDPKKRADCMSKAKQNIEIDGMAFKQEKDKWYWLSIKLKGKTVTNLHKIPVEFTKDTERSVVLKPVGKDEGKKRGGNPGETKVDVPNDYQIVFDDPKHGKMVYEAKIGLTGS